MQINEVIRKTGKSQWTIFSHKGRKLGTYRSLIAAKRRLHQIEYFKKLREDAEPSISKSDMEGSLDRMRGLLKGVDMRQVRQGFEDEKEHDDGSEVDVVKGSKKKRADHLLKVVLAHLKEKPDYYTRLKRAMKK